MPGILAGVLAALQLTLSFLAPPVFTQQLKSGSWLRLHVVAQDDTAEMQRVKRCVRDAVLDCYRELHPSGASGMQQQAAAILPQLTEAAESAARREGFGGEVQVTLGPHFIGERTLLGVAIPAGEYPALMVLLGDAQGQNWWGLIDPELSLLLAKVTGGEEDAPVLWDWSLKALLCALLGIPAGAEGA